MTRDSQIFNRGFSLRQAFRITNFVILVAGASFTLLVLGILLKVRRDEIGFLSSHPTGPLPIEVKSIFHSIYWGLGSLLALSSSFLALSLFFRRKLEKLVVGNIDGILKNIGGNRNLFEEQNGEARFQRLSPEGPKEIAKIAFQLNLLYARLQASFKEIQSERDRAENATRAKSRFLSVMSHEIRTPLNSMIGLTDVLLESELDPAQIQHLNVLQRSGHSLLRILNDILDFSRLEAGKLEIEFHEFELFPFLGDIESLMRFDAEAKGIKFRIIAPSSDYRLRGDSVRIRQALLNLVGNSIKFTTEGSVEVRVTAIHHPASHFQFEVSDTGIGIEKEHQSKLFTEFNQADASITRRYGGTGLGLSISRSIIELLGGKISIDSTRGQGTTFRFTVPLSIAAQWKARYEETPTVGTIGAPRDRSIDGRVNQPEPSLAPEPAAQKMILIVDDDEDNHRLLSAYIGFRNDFRTVHAFSAKEAIGKVHQDDFVLIIMDMQMPVMDGLEATALIRSLQTRGLIPKFPIVILSANTFAEDREKSLAAGADAHAAKPIKLSEFNQLLKRWIPGTS